MKKGYDKLPISIHIVLSRFFSTDRRRTKGNRKIKMCSKEVFLKIDLTKFTQNFKVVFNVEI